MPDHIDKPWELERVGDVRECERCHADMPISLGFICPFCVEELEREDAEREAKLANDQ